MLSLELLLILSDATGHFNPYIPTGCRSRLAWLLKSVWFLREEARAETDRDPGAPYTGQGGEGEGRSWDHPETDNFPDSLFCKSTMRTNVEKSSEIRSHCHSHTASSSARKFFAWYTRGSGRSPISLSLHSN